MAKKVDCTELEKAIKDLALSIGAQDDVQTLDDVVAEIQKSFPIMPREEIVNAIVNATATEAREADALAKKLNEIKRNARMEKATAEKIAKLETFLETGQLPEAPKPRKAASETLQQARKTVANLTKWLKTADPAMQKAMQAKLDALNKQIEAGDVVMEEKREGQLHETLKALQEQIEAAQRQITDEKTLKALQARIDELQDHLDAGTLPETRTRAERGTGPADLLRDIRDDLKKQLSASEPAQKARIQKQIDALNDRIEAGDFAPAPKAPELPQSNELMRLQLQRDELRQEIRRQVANLKPRSLLSRATEPFNVVRDLLTTGEFSFVLRQGGPFALSHPVKSAQIFREAMRAFRDPVKATKAHGDMMEDPDIPLYLTAGGHISPVGPNAELNAREETSLSNLFYRLPVARAFTRANAVYVNKVRLGIFKVLKENGTATGEMTLEEAKLAANAGNQSSGRGYETAGGLSALARYLFSAQFLTSRFKVLYGQPIWGHGEISAPLMRKAIAREYARVLLGLAAVYLLGKMAGGEVEWDPRSADFGKIKFGKVRLDPMMGFSQIIVFHTRVGLGILSHFFPEIREYKSTKTGRTMSLTNPKYGQVEMSDIIDNFERSKTAPQISIALNLATHERPGGQPTSPASELLSLHPITYGDIIDVGQEELGAPKEIALSVLGFLGMGLQVYQDKQKKRDLKWYEPW